MTALFPEPDEICPGIRNQGDHMLRRSLGFAVPTQHLEQDAQAVVQPRLFLGVVRRGVHGGILPDGVHQLQPADPARFQPLRAHLQQLKNCGAAGLFFKKQVAQLHIIGFAVGQFLPGLDYAVRKLRRPNRVADR